MINKFVKGALIGFFLLTIAFIAWKGNLSIVVGKEERISVLGTGKVVMSPRVARFTAGVTITSGSVSEAMNQEKQITKNIISSLKDSGVADKDIRTTNFSVWPQTSDYYEENIRKTKITGYSVSNNVEVKVREIERVSDILGKVIATGANNVYGLSFGADEPEEQEKEARDKAVEEARQKAEGLARAASRRLGKIVSISEGNIPYTFNYSAADGRGGGGGPAVETGSLEVSQTVTVVFELR